MKVFFLINSLGAGGAERSTAELAKFLFDERHEVVIFCLSKKLIGIEKEIRDYGIRVIFSKSRSLLGRLKELRRFIESEKPDLMHSVLFDANLLLRITKFLSPKLTIIQSLVSTPYSSERIRDPRFPHSKLKIIKLFDCISARAVNSYYHAITQTVLSHYKPLFKLKEEDCFVINRGRKLNSFINEKAYLKEKFGFGSSFVFLTIGRQEVQKGQLVILEALKEIKAHHPYAKDIKIVFLGREGGMTQHLRSFVKSNELEQFVSFMGFRNDVEEILASSDVFLFPSYLEGMGGALVEALAAGCPVICSDIPVLKEVIGTEDGAIFVKPGDFVQTALAMVKLYCDDGLRSELSRKSLDKFKSSYQVEQIHGRMLEMYNRLVSMQWK